MTAAPLAGCTEHSWETSMCWQWPQNVEPCGSTGDVPITGADSHTLWLISLCLLCCASASICTKGDSFRDHT